MGAVSALRVPAPGEFRRPNHPFLFLRLALSAAGTVKLSARVLLTLRCLENALERPGISRGRAIGPSEGRRNTLGARRRDTLGSRRRHLARRNHTRNLNRGQGRESGLCRGTGRRSPRALEDLSMLRHGLPGGRAVCGVVSLLPVGLPAGLALSDVSLFPAGLPNGLALSDAASLSRGVPRWRAFLRALHAGNGGRQNGRDLRGLLRLRGCLLRLLGGR